MSQQTQSDRHPLSRRHFNRVVKRPHKTATKLFPLWAITYVTKGKTLVPAGSVSIQVLSSQPDPTNPKQENIELTCITGEVEHHAGITHFSRPRMSHNFARNPKPGARGRVLDPRDSDDPTVKKGDKPNADWVRWALDADKARLAAVDQNHRLPVAPELPAIVVGFANPELVPFQMSLRLKKDVAAHMGRSLSHVDEMDPETLEVLARAHWDGLFKAPGSEGNDTGLWLINAEYISNFSRATRIYEDYSNLVGCNVWNPARDVAKMGLTREGVFGKVNIARILEIMEALSKTDAADADVPADTEGKSPVEVLEDEFLALIEEIRTNMGYTAPLFDDMQIIDFINHPEREILEFGKHDLAEKLGEENTVTLLRGVLELTRPHLLPYVSDAELVSAAKNLGAPLFAAKLPRVQVLRRDLRVPMEDAFRFTPETLGRERVYANMWPGDWSPKAEYVEAYDAARPRRNRRRNRRNKKHGATK